MSRVDCGTGAQGCSDNVSLGVSAPTATLVMVCEFLVFVKQLDSQVLDHGYIQSY
jgi:hypothetical protein